MKRAEPLKLNYQPSSWPEAAPDPGHGLFHPLEMLQLPPEAVSRLDPLQLSTYSKMEAAHFFVINIFGEKFGIESLHATSPELFAELGLSEYRDRLLLEEDSHTRVFKKILRGLAQPLPESFPLLGSFKKLQNERDIQELFSKIFVFEHVTTALSARAMKVPTVEPVIASVHRYHWEDERHHVRVTRKILQRLSSDIAPVRSQETLSRAQLWSSILARALFPEAAVRLAASWLGDEVFKLAFEFSLEHPLIRPMFVQAQDRLRSDLGILGD